jgi:hypothetical protein
VLNINWQLIANLLPVIIAAIIFEIILILIGSFFCNQLIGLVPSLKVLLITQLQVMEIKNV